MILLIGEMVGCLIIAAGIGLIVGWLLRHLSVRSLTQHVYDVTTALQQKEHALHQTQLELKAKVSTNQIYESKMASLEPLLRGAQDELAASRERLTAVQAELAAASERAATLEAERDASIKRFSESDSTIAAFEQEAKEANAVRAAAQQDLRRRDEELRQLRERLAETEKRASETERLKAVVTELEPAQGRVHWLEVELSEKDVQHRAVLSELEQEREALSRRITELEPFRQEVQHQAELVREWESKYNRALKQQASNAALLEKQRATFQEIQGALAERDRTLAEKESQLEALQRQLDELRVLQAEMGKREEEISKLRKRLVEARASLTVRGNRDIVTSSRVGQEDGQLSLGIERSKPRTQSPRSTSGKSEGKAR